MGSWQNAQLNTHVPEAVRRHEQRMARLEVSRWATRAEAEGEVAAALAYKGEDDLVSMEAHKGYLEELATAYAVACTEPSSSHHSWATVSAGTLRRLEGELALVRARCWRLAETERKRGVETAGAGEAERSAPASKVAECSVAQRSSDEGTVYRWQEDGALSEISVPVRDEDVQEAAMQLAAAIGAGLEGIECEEQREAAMMASTEAMLRLANNLEEGGSYAAGEQSAADSKGEDTVMPTVSGS